MNDNSESWHLMNAYMISISRNRHKYLQALNSAHNIYWTDLRCRTLRIIFIKSCKRLLISETGHGFPAMLCILLSCSFLNIFSSNLKKNMDVKMNCIWIITSMDLELHAYKIRSNGWVVLKILFLYCFR